MIYDQRNSAFKFSVNKNKKLNLISRLPRNCDKLSCLPIGPVSLAVVPAGFLLLLLLNWIRANKKNQILQIRVAIEG